MDSITRRRVCSAHKGQKRSESLGVRVSDLRSSVMRMDIEKAMSVHPSIKSFSDFNKIWYVDR